MKSLLNILVERFINPNKNGKKAGTPDYINIGREYSFFSKYARAFIYYKKKGLILWSEPSETHDDIVSSMDKSEKKKFGFENAIGVSDLRFDTFQGGYEDSTKEDELADERAQNKYINKQKKRGIDVEQYVLGRIWRIPSAKNENDFINVIVSWNELTSNEFNTIFKDVIKNYNQKFNTDIDDFCAIDNNSELKEMHLSDKKIIIINKRTKENEEAIKLAQKLHAGTTEEIRELKRKTTELYRKHRDEANQKRYNSQKSKTAAEFNNNYTTRYNKVTGKVEYGDKIGDSLTNNIKPLKEFLINNKSTGIIKNINYKFVDLDLPSGNLWANCNLGAEEEIDCGHYYQWGGLEPMDNKECTWENCPYCKNGQNRYNEKTWKKYKGNQTELKKSDDIASIMLGNDCKTPSQNDFEELIDYTICKVTTLNNVKGATFTSKKNPYKFIFIPVCGCKFENSFYEKTYRISIWSSTVNEDFCHQAYYLDIDENGDVCYYDSGFRCYGQPIRPIKKVNK